MIEFAKQGKESVVFAVEGTKQGRANNEQDGNKAKTCPCFKCHAPLRFTDSQKGKFWACTNPDCKSTYSDLKGKPVKPVICPKCKKNPLRKMNGKNGFFWVCSCGYTASDEKGKPQASRVCKKCGSVEKKSVAKTNGKTYWKCIGCKQVSFEDK